MGSKSLSEEELERLAVEEILKQTKRAAVRAETAGPSGWLKCPLPQTNKRFLHNTLLSTLHSNNVLANRKRKHDKHDDDASKSEKQSELSEKSKTLKPSKSCRTLEKKINGSSRHASRHKHSSAKRTDCEEMRSSIEKKGA